MTCRQLGGACDLEFKAETFEEMANLSQQHGVEMFQKGDAEHMKAMDEMISLMNTPEAMNKWLDEKRREFEALPGTV